MSKDPCQRQWHWSGKTRQTFHLRWKKRKFFLNWSLNIFWVRKWDLLYISISGFQIMSAGSLQRMSWFQFQVSLYRLYFYALQSSSFKYIYLWLYSLCNVHVFLSFKCIYSYFNCVHYEPLTNPSLYLILVTPSYSLAFQAKFTSSHSWEVFFGFHTCVRFCITWCDLRDSAKHWLSIFGSFRPGMT